MRKPDPYPLMRQFMAPAWARSAVWRVVAVFLVFEIVFEATPYLYQAPGNGGLDGVTRVRPIDTLIEFGAFIIPCTALLLAIHLLHGRGLASLLGPRHAFWQDFRRVTLAVGLVLLVQEPLRIWSEWEYFIQIRDVGQWAVMLPLGLAVLLVQVGTEEIYFRGYLQQQLAVLHRSRLVWLVAPSIYFGLAHFVNGTSPTDSVIWTVWAGCLGLACADLTARTGNLGAALGLHLANNIFALVIIGTLNGPGSGLALFLYPQASGSAVVTAHPDTNPLFPLVDLAFALIGVWIMWMAARVAVRR